ncbi:ABC transporter substrate-binding protein [Maledivibacter halophilus]|uniref:Peptide/nickel transport system substrate-binding protein n=1 Tax=Maledivibacter halophilus TaxID=36842 RepID=A0A1T5LKE7_9FIRM|nr:ABC transporter substrate-binding protein [Maledivibacter halophilus]SKC76109.1 peptide/nickel transport system substrate-binding protein [Maledivibacter halophilus]
MKKLLSLIIALSLIITIFTGCGNKEAAQETSTEKADNSSEESVKDKSEDKFGGTLNIGTYADPDTLNPLVGNDIAGSWVLNLVYPTLMVLDEDGNKIPYIIEEPDISEDGLTITITLKDGLKWQDGTPLTSKDIAFTYKTLYEQKLQWQWSVLEGVTWETPNDKTIVFSLSKPFPTFITTIGFWQRIVPAHIWEEIDDVKNFTNDNPVGLGPFKLTDYERGQYYVLESVDEWFLAPEGKPYLDKVIYKPYPDVNTMVLALKSGDIDLTAKEIPAAAAKELKSNDGFNVVQNMSLGYEHMSFNLRNELLQDVNVRKAMAMAIDRSKIVNFAFDGDAVEMNGIISPVYKKYQTGNDFPSYDVDGAKKLLADGGYKDTDNDGILNGPNGENLSFKAMFTNTVSEHEKLVRILVDNMEAIGIQLVPSPMDKSLQTDKLYNTHQWELTIGTWGIIDDVESSMSTLFLSTSSLNWMAWNNESADEAMLNMQSALTEEEIMKDMDVFQKEITNDIPDIPMVVKKMNFAYNKKFDGFKVYPSNLRGLVDPQSLAQVYKVE